MAKGSGWAFGPVTDANVERVFRNLAIGWYALALIQAIGVAYFFATTGSPKADLIDAIAALAAGYFLNARRSRTLAVALFVYAVATLAASIASKLGLLSEGSNTLLAVAMLWLAWRGIPATYFYQRRRCADVRWLSTGLILAAAVVVTGVIFVAVGLMEVHAQRAGSDISTALRYFAYTAMLFFPPVILVALLTMRWPFTEPDAACPWPPKKRD